MSLLDAMKLFLCYLLNDGTTPGQITVTSAAEIWVLMGEAFNARFNGGAAIAALTVECGEGSTSGTTHAYITGAVSGESFVYMVGVSSLPAAGADLSTWTVWDGTSDITAADGASICIAQVDENGIVTRAGIGTATTAI